MSEILSHESDQSPSNCFYLVNGFIFTKVGKCLLRYHLTINRMTQQELAEQTGLTKQTISRYANNSHVMSYRLFNAFSRILKRINYPSMPIHSLRHTHAVLQMEAGADMKYIQTRLGHGSMQITADVYSHISNNIEVDRSTKFEEHLNNILN